MLRHDDGGSNHPGELPDPLVRVVRGETAVPLQDTAVADGKTRAGLHDRPFVLCIISSHRCLAASSFFSGVIISSSREVFPKHILQFVELRFRHRVADV